MITFFSTKPGKFPITVQATLNTPFVTGDILEETSVVISTEHFAYVCETDQHIRQAVANLQYAHNACPSIDVEQVIAVGFQERKDLVNSIRARCTHKTYANPV